MKITLNILKDNIDFLHRRHKQIEAIDEALKDFNPDFPVYFPADDEMEIRFIKSLERELDDEENHYISYFIYDLECGEKWEEDSLTNPDGTSVPLKTVEDLWNLLHEGEE